MSAKDGVFIVIFLFKTILSHGSFLKSKNKTQWCIKMHKALYFQERDSTLTGKKVRS